MASITSLGVGSGLDAESLVTKLMSVEKMSLTALQTKESAVNTKISAFGSITSLVDTLSSKLSTIKSINTLAAFSATSTNTDTLKATASTTAGEGSYDINVTQLASAHKLLSGPMSGGLGVSTVVGAGTVDISVAGGSTTTITLGSSATLGDLRDQINASSSGVTAGIINTSSGVQLSLTAKETGKAISFDPSGLTTAPSALKDNSFSSIYSTGTLDYKTASTNTVVGGAAAIIDSGTFSIDLGGSAQNIVMGAGSTLEDLRASISSNVSGVTATIENDQLVLTANTPGTSLSFSTNVGDFAGSVLENISVTATTDLQKSTITSGTVSGGGTATVGKGSVSLTVGGASFSVPLASDSSTLNDLRDAINAAGTGATASIVSNQLVLTADQFGDAITFDPSGLTKAPLAVRGQYTETAPGQIAKFTVDGQAAESTSNSDSTTIPGLTLNLAAVGSSTINVARSTDSISTAIDGFVSAYNDLNTKIKSLTAYDANNKKGSTLTGDSTLKLLQSRLTSLIGAKQTGSGTYSYMSELGIAFNKDGSLSLNSTKLSAAISKDSASVTNVLTSAATALHKETSAMTLTGGFLASKTSSLQMSIKDYQGREETMNLRLVAIEKRYRAMFSSLDTSVSAMSNTSTYLTQMLAKL